jgi:4'-phosphopantetheinyl transferase
MRETTGSDWEIPPIGVALNKNEVHVWKANLDHQQPIIEMFWNALSDDERERAARFRFLKDRLQFIFARGILREILGFYLKVPPSSLRFQYSAFGKPWLAETHLQFNVSHASEIILLAFAIDLELGIDVEKVRADLATEEIAERFFSAHEVAVLRSLPKTLRAEAFFNCWTQKEAFIKAIGEGLSCPLDQFDVVPAPGEPAGLLATRVQGNPASKWLLKSLKVKPGFKAAIAVENKGWELRCWQWAKRL